jgi:hypothetical protein
MSHWVKFVQGGHSRSGESECGESEKGWWVYRFLNLEMRSVQERSGKIRKAYKGSGSEEGKKGGKKRRGLGAVGGRRK